MAWRGTACFIRVHPRKSLSHAFRIGAEASVDNCKRLFLTERSSS
jgi:hypothetical protein